MNILLASAELAPLAKAGGMADVAAYLPEEWQKSGHKAIVILPKYYDIDIHSYGFRPTHLVLNVPMGDWTEHGSLWQGTIPGTDVPVYLIENDDYFTRHGIYGDPKEFEDNDKRFIFFCRAIFEAAKALNFKPDIIHAHDYHTAFTMPMLRSWYKNDPFFADTAGVYTIHNLAYQGWFKPEKAMEYSSFGMEEFYAGSWFEHRGTVNAMKIGIMFADKITTVSPTYAGEIRTSYFSEGMQDVLNQRGSDLIGILNGVDYETWNPEKDDFLYSKYSPDYIQGKLENKRKFLEGHGLNESDNLDLPLVGIVSRLTEQKGIDILMHKLEAFIAENKIRFVLLGNGDTMYEDYFRYLRWKYPGRALVHLGYNTELSHRIIACSDFFLLPSRFEPCGLTQMYALKYGTIPIVRRTGGLADTVREYRSDAQTGNGFDFINYNANDMAYAINRALGIYNKAPHWDQIRLNAMSEDYSAARSAAEYLKVFAWALEKK
jgi:starch synthase